MKTINHPHDFVVLGGGLAGVVAAVTAARQGMRTALVQDRPVLGGNASTEIRVPPVGASQCNFAYSRETGLVEELFLNNLHRNPTWSPEGWNLELESLVRNEPNLYLFLNTAVCDVQMNAQRDRLINVKAYGAMAETWHTFYAPYFADCTGDGTVAVLAGAAFRMGVEARSEFEEPMCPDEPTEGTMGMSIQIRTRDAGRPMPFTKPPWVSMELGPDDFGEYRPVCEDFFPDAGGFWWLEWGGELDTVHDTVAIKDELQRITLAVWDYLKNRSPLAEKLATYELEWMGTIPGKRESRRFEGDHILTTLDIDAQARFDDAVAFGGWGFDDHPPAGFYDKVHPSTHQYLRGPHNVPLRSLYSRNIANLYLAGRNISATHYALSCTRVMLTCAQLGEAVGMAAAHSVWHDHDPRRLATGGHIRDIQRDLIRADHHIHALSTLLDHNVAPQAKVTASSVYSDSATTPSWGTDTLRDDRLLQLPVITERLDKIALRVDAEASSVLRYRLCQGPENGSTYPDKQLVQGECPIAAGKDQWIELPIASAIEQPGWHFLILEKNPAVAVHVTESPPGRRWYYRRPQDPIRPNPFCDWTARTLAIGMAKAADADGAKVVVPDWNDHARKFTDISRFLQFAYCFQVTPEQCVYEPSTVVGSHSRPSSVPNLWVSAPSSFEQPQWLDLTWDHPQSIESIQILFDSSLHFHFWQSWQGYPVRSIPSIVRDYRVVVRTAEGAEHVVAQVQGNYQRNRGHLAQMEGAQSLRIEILKTNGLQRAQVYSVRVFTQQPESSGVSSAILDLPVAD